MPPINKNVEIPDTLNPYTFHGVDLQYRKGVPEALGDCPFCGRSGKFSVRVENGQWRCLVCSEGPEKGKPIKGGNSMVFLRTLYRLSKESMTDNTAIETLSKNRGYVSSQALEAWGIAKSITTREWLVPGYNIEGALCQLYRYVKLGVKYKLLASPRPSFQQQIHGLNLWSKSKQIVYVCEGYFDGVAFYEVMSQTKQTENGFAPTGSLKASLFNEANILALPGCNVFNDKWAPLFSGKRVVLLFDNDHPKTVDGRLIPPGGLEGAKRIASILSNSSKPPASIEYLQWGPLGYDLNLESGTDLRDVFRNAGDTLGPRIAALDYLLGKVTPLETESVTDEARGSKSNASIELTPCSSYRALTNAWRKAMRWTDGLDMALSAMLASVVSVRLVGEQLWIKIVGPPSCGKTSLAKALGTAKDFVVCEDVIRGFTSGWKQEGDGEGFDLASRIRDKTLITMDGDTLLQSPNLSNILGEARRLYDGELSSHFKNGMGKAVDRHRFTWLICGTSSLRSMDSSELGERFLDCVIMEGIDYDFEDEVLLRVANRVTRNLATEITDKQGSQEDPEMEAVMKLTGGYVEWLRKNAAAEMSTIEVSHESSYYCSRLGKFVAFMRARPSTRQDEVAEREFAARLTTQLIRLAGCLAVVLNKKTIDSEVSKRTQKIALDTARGKTIELSRFLYEAGEDGLEVKSLALYTSNTELEIRKLLKFLRDIEVTEVFTRNPAKGIKGRPAWKLTPRMQKLWKEVHNLQ